MGAHFPRKMPIPKGFPALHQYAPRAWRRTHCITGDFEFDASIEHCHNMDALGKIGSRVIKDTAYGYRTGYDGYSGYSGDD